jgi:hypothetical protein
LALTTGILIGWLRNYNCAVLLSSPETSLNLNCVLETPKAVQIDHYIIAPVSAYPNQIQITVTGDVEQSLAEQLYGGTTVDSVLDTGARVSSKRDFDLAKVVQAIQGVVIARPGVTVTQLLCFRYWHKNVLKYRTRQNVGGISILVFNTKCNKECRPHFAACGTPDRAIGSKPSDAATCVCINTCRNNKSIMKTFDRPNNRDIASVFRQGLPGVCVDTKSARNVKTRNAIFGAGRPFTSSVVLAYATVARL